MFDIRTNQGSVLSALVLGAFIAVGSAAAADTTPKAGPVHFTTMIGVSNLDKSVDYYTRLVGLKEATRVPLGNGGFEVILSPSGKDWDSAIGLIYQPGRKEPMTHGTFYNRLAVFLPSAEEVDARVKKIAEEGYKIVTGPSTSAMNNTGGKRTYRYAHFKD